MKGRLTRLYEQLAAEGGNFWGNNILQHEAQLLRLVQETGAVSALDYGCGRGDPWRAGLAQRLGLRGVTLYDPAFPSHDVLPARGQRFDAVLCSDVLEHVPEDELHALIRLLFHHANKFVWASVCCRPAKKKFPDGSNVHVTVRPFAWWNELFEAHRQAERVKRAGATDELDYFLTETP